MNRLLNKAPSMCQRAGAQWDLNPQPLVPQTNALPIELCALITSKELLHRCNTLAEMCFFVNQQ